METFRFAVMGAGKIARKFCDAAAMTEGCAVAAIASKSMERAEALCQEKGIKRAYDSYERMLREVEPDCVYIATTCDAHYDLSMLCARHNTPVLCEKAMFTSSAEAERFFTLAGEKGVFAMEALWSRFLPAVNKAKTWIEENRIGKVVMAQMDIGFRPAFDPDNRYFSPKLGGGASNDLTVYGLQIIMRVLSQPIKRVSVEAVAAPTGVDESSIVLLRMGDGTPAVVKSSFATALRGGLTVYGTEGFINVPNAHFGGEAALCAPDGTVVERFTDEATQNGFTYEIEEVMRCVRAGLQESPVVPWETTMACCRVFDKIAASAKGK